ncbi:FecR family protein [Pseudoduganella namucuonensis]|uniref:FecR family protein n=1 Tax=Pseudoduganella namucuonensis TaxID=1035707 RepID=A0A1I7IIW3_9BURK|nr:FecR domain-containing protein [Pseudoduganella namucuonensis]SFU72849.1 FecR family protein [Pseudoduganella namucuonensis]
MKTTLPRQSNRGPRLPALPALLALSAALASGGACAAPGDIVAQVTHLAGVLTVKRPDGSTKFMNVKSQVMEGDVLNTGEEAFARLKFIDSSEMVLRPNSVLKISEFTFRQPDPKGDKIRIEMLKGGFRAVSGMVGKRNREAVSFSLPTATIGIRGTHLGALFCQNDCGGVPTPTGQTPDNGLHVDVAAGAVVVTPNQAPGLAPSATSPSPATVLNAGQFGYLPPPRNGVQPPLVLVPPAQAVQVRMPASISQNAPAGGATGKTSDPECVVQ